LFSAAESTDLSTAAIVIALVAVFAGMVIRIIAMVKRFHDLDKSGYYVLLHFVPLAGIVLELMLLFVAGTQGPNQFGPQPD
jgi:uncharacterized membrane protein YhaH (DUF805 family)